MSKYTISIGKKLKLNSELDELFQKTEKLDKSDQITLDLSPIGFISPEVLIILVSISKLIFNKTGNVVTWDKINSNAYSYLERIDVGNLDFVKLKKPTSAKKYYRSSSSENLVELSIITDWKKIGYAIQKTKGVINRWLPDKPMSYRNDLITLIRETVENSIDHSGLHAMEGVCFFIAQKYEKNGKVEIQIAVGDIGVGMLTSLRRVFPETKNDTDAICGAFMEGKSGRPMGGGLGYHTVRDALSNLRGSITIRSGSGVMLYSHGHNRPYIYRMRSRFPGTQIIFHCKT